MLVACLWAAVLVAVVLAALANPWLALLFPAYCAALLLGLRRLMRQRKNR